MRMLWTERWYHPPKFTRWNPVSRYNGIWKWGLREETAAGWRFFGTRHVFRNTTKVWKLGFLDSVLVNILIATPAIWYSREAYGRNIVNGWFAFKLCYCFLIHLLDSCLLLLSISYPMRYKYRTCFILCSIWWVALCEILKCFRNLFLQLLYEGLPMNNPTSRIR